LDLCLFGLSVPSCFAAEKVESFFAFLMTRRRQKQATQKRHSRKDWKIKVDLGALWEAYKASIAARTTKASESKISMVTKNVN